MEIEEITSSGGEPKRLSPEEFLETFKKVPRLAVDLIATDENERVLLTRRRIPPFPDSWHFPGTFYLEMSLLQML